VHAAQLRPDEIVGGESGWVTALDRTLVDVARASPAMTALVAADHALHHRLVTVTELGTALHDARLRPGSAAARRVLALTDGRSESPGESRTRLALADLLPLESQVEIRDEAGDFVARVDLACEEAMLLIEFDGKGKYLTLLKPGQTTADAVLTEKRREDRIRELGYFVIRVTWADLNDPVALRSRVQRMYRRGRELRRAGQGPAGSFRPARRVG
jgi:very-short-patch-repair endonuclease